MPVPDIFERVYLRIGFGAGLVLEKHVVIAVRVKWRVKINEINRLTLNEIPQDLKIVAIVKGVHGKYVVNLQCLLESGYQECEQELFFQVPIFKKFDVITFFGGVFLSLFLVVRIISFHCFEKLGPVPERNFKPGRRHCEQ